MTPGPGGHRGIHQLNELWVGRTPSLEWESHPPLSQELSWGSSFCCTLGSAGTRGVMGSCSSWLNNLLCLGILLLLLPPPQQDLSLLPRLPCDFCAPNGDLDCSEEATPTVI